MTTIVWASPGLLGQEALSTVDDATSIWWKQLDPSCIYQESGRHHWYASIRLRSKFRVCTRWLIFTSGLSAGLADSLMTLQQRSWSTLLFYLVSTAAIPLCTGFLTSSSTFSEQGARMVKTVIKSELITSHLIALHWLPIKSRILSWHSGASTYQPQPIYLNLSHHIFHHLNQDRPHHLICYLSLEFVSIWRSLLQPCFSNVLE